MFLGGVGLAELRVGRQRGTGTWGSACETGAWEGELLEMAALGHLWQRLESPTLTSPSQPPMTVSHEICSLLPKTMDMQKMLFPSTSVTMFYVLQQFNLLLFFFFSLLCFVYEEVDSFPLSWQATLSGLLISLISLLPIHAGFEAWASFSTSVT